MKTKGDFPFLLQAFFSDRLMRQRQASAHTIVASYREHLPHAPRVRRAAFEKGAIDATS